jgi:hypothetical protein
MEACLEKMDTTDLEAITVRQEVPKEAAVETIRALEDQYGDRYLAVGHHRQPKKWTQGNGRTQQKLAAAQGQLTDSAIPTLRRRHGHQGPGKDDDVQGAPKGMTFEKRHQAQQ